MKKWYQFIIALMLLVIPILIIITDKKKLKKDRVYSIALITEIEKGLKRSYVLKFNFLYKDSIYSSIDQIYKNRKELVGKRFIIRFLPEDPDINEILFDKRIWCDTLKAPFDGWEEIPSYFPFYQELNGVKIRNIPCMMYQEDYYEKLKKK